MLPAGNAIAGANCFIRWCIFTCFATAVGYIFRRGLCLKIDIQPGKWDTAVGGHVDFGEPVETALRREAREELGLVDFNPVKLTPYVHESDVERELINPFVVYCSEGILLVPDPEEISEGRFWHYTEIEKNLGHDVFTPNFESEYKIIKKYIKQ